MMSANAHLALVSSSAPSHALAVPHSKHSYMRSRCTPLRMSVPRQQLPAPLKAATNTIMHPTTPAVVATSGGVAEQAAAVVSAASTDRFRVLNFHHVEFWCADAASAAGRFSFALGVPVAAKSDLTTGNTAHASHVLRSRTGPLALLFSAPYAHHFAAHVDDAAAASPVLPSFSADGARRFAADYGLAVRAVALRVADAAEAFRASVAGGARPAFAPTDLGDGFVLAEVELYGDAVLRFVSYPDGGGTAAPPFLPGFESVEERSSGAPDFGLNRFDHIVGGVPDNGPVAAYIAGFTGFHKFSSFDGDVVGTPESGVNAIVLANAAENVLLTLLEPVHGTKRRSQIQTFLDHHGGPGVQHLAIGSDDLLATLRHIRSRSSMGGFELLPPPPPGYYDDVRRLAGDVLSEEQIKGCQELGVRVDKDENGGVLLQKFAKAPGDRPTLLLEFIQRIGCVETDENGQEYQRGGCGGFATNNVKNLIKDIEDYDKTIDAYDPAAPVAVAP